MTSNETNGNSGNGSGGSGGGLVDVLKSSPAVSRLGDAAKDYAKARGGDVVRNVAGKLGNVTESMNEKADNGGFKGPAISTALQKVGEGENPVKAAVSGVGTGIKEKVKSAFGRSGRSRIRSRSRPPAGRGKRPPTARNRPRRDRRRRRPPRPAAVSSRASSPARRRSPVHPVVLARKEPRHEREQHAAERWRRDRRPEEQPGGGTSG